MKYIEDKNPESKEYLILNFIIPYFENNIINKKFKVIYLIH